MNDARAITDALESTGVFDRAKLLDPEAIVNVSIYLASTKDPNDYRVWLAMFAERYNVTTSDLATDALTVLSHCGGFVASGIARAAQSEARELVTT